MLKLDGYSDRLDRQVIYMSAGYIGTVLLIKEEITKKIWSESFLMLCG